jgi:tRNA(His) guanylyltransferase
MTNKLTCKKGDALGDRMKLYESIECGRRFMPLCPILARIDGRAFHSFTRGMIRPYDSRLCKLMRETMLYLARETNALVGYTQSDETTLCWHSTDPKSQVWFDGRIAKMTSQLAAHATLEFNALLAKEMPEFLRLRPTFDARVWQVPNRAEAANVFVWRELDAVKNSITMAASTFYSHKELLYKNGAQKQELLRNKGINWNDYPAFFKRGSYVQRQHVKKPFGAEEIERLPPKHRARTDPKLVVERADYSLVELPVLTTIENRESVLFEGADPVVHKRRTTNDQ